MFLLHVAMKLRLIFWRKKHEIILADQPSSYHSNPVHIIHIIPKIRRFKSKRQQPTRPKETPSSNFSHRIEKKNNITKMIFWERTDKTLTWLKTGTTLENPERECSVVDRWFQHRTQNQPPTQNPKLTPNPEPTSNPEPRTHPQPWTRGMPRRPPHH